MTVTAKETIAAMRARAESERTQDATRARAGLDAAARAARVLTECFGVTKVILFGSLAQGGFHAGSDIDLAVEGLAPGTLIDAGVAAEDAGAPFAVDVVPLERLDDGFRKRIESNGLVMR